MENIPPSIRSSIKLSQEKSMAIIQPEFFIYQLKLHIVNIKFNANNRLIIKNFLTYYM